MEEITTLTAASSKSKSLRTTVPMSIVKLLNLQEGDKIKWEIQPKDNKFLVIVSRLDGC